MKIYPITNGTPDNSLEFGVTTEADCNAVKQLIVTRGFTPAIIRRDQAYPTILIYGRGFHALVASTGPLPGCDHEGCLVFGHQPSDRAWTARELCHWLEEKLDA